VRHGETAWNAEGRMQGQLDIPLNAVGRWQAGRVAAALERYAALSQELAAAAAPTEPTGRPV